LLEMGGLDTGASLAYGRWSHTTTARRDGHGSEGTAAAAAWQAAGDQRGAAAAAAADSTGPAAGPDHAGGRADGAARVGRRSHRAGGPREVRAADDESPAAGRGGVQCVWAGLGPPLGPRGQLSAHAADAGGGGDAAGAAGELRVWGPGAAGVHDLWPLPAQ